MRRRVALLFATSGHSGVDRIVANLLPELSRWNCSFDLLTIRGHGPYLNSIPANVTLRTLQARSKRTVLPAIAWYLWRYQPQALLTANHHLNRAALVARKLTGVKARIAIRMGMSLTAKGMDMGAFRQRKLFASMRRWYPEADAVITPSNGVAEDLVEIASVSPQHLHVIPNPVINERFQSLAEEVADHPWLVSPEYQIILSVGSLEPRKDFSTLIQAFAQIRTRRSCRLIILGDGAQREELLRLAEELNVIRDVDLPGFKANPYPLMREASVFALSSRREGSPVAIAEALACGTPVVSTDCLSGPSEILQHGRVGQLVPVGDSQAMTLALEKTLNDPPLSDFLKRAVTEYRADRAAERYLQALGIRE